METESKQPIVMKQQSPIAWDDAVLYAIVAILLVVCAVYFTIHFSAWWLLMWVPIILLTVRLYGMTAREVELTENELIIWQWIGKKTILLNEVVIAGRYEWENRCFRLWGYGGHHTRAGWYHSAQTGKFLCLMNDPSEMILLTLQNGQKIVFSCKNSEAVLQAIQNNSGK